MAKRPSSHSEPNVHIPISEDLVNAPGLAKRLSEREEFYRGVLDSLAEGVIITDANSRILYANRTMEQLTGYTRDELIGRISYQILAPEKNWGLMQRRLKERLSGKTESYEHELVRKDGTISWIRVKATPYRNTQCEIIGTVGTISCIDRQKDLENQNEYLLAQIRDERDSENMLGKSPAFQKIREQIQMVGPTCANVLILGESGTGKELVSQAIHEHSSRKDKPFVKVNCASVPKDLFESEFFGHVRGAFTGAIKDRVGRFELANEGTLFLDEVGEIPLELQSKLLRVLQEGQFERLGEDRTRTVSVRIIAATNRDLQDEARQGRFRMDLYYRLSVFPIEIPTLRERPEDIPLLANHFLQKAAHRAGLGGLHLTEAQMQEFQNYAWPGNIRELQNVIERAVILARNGDLRFDLGQNLNAPKKSESPRGRKSAPALPSLHDLKDQEKTLIQQALQQAGGKIYGADGAAALLGLRPTTLASKIARWGLK